MAFFTNGSSVFMRFAADEIDVLVGGCSAAMRHDLDRLGHGEEAGGPDGLEPHARMLVGGQLLEAARARSRHPVAPVAQHARRGGAGPEVGRRQHPLQQVGVDDVVVLVEPQRFEQLVLVARDPSGRARRSTSRPRRSPRPCRGRSARCGPDSARGPRAPSAARAASRSVRRRSSAGVSSGRPS